VLSLIQRRRKGAAREKTVDRRGHSENIKEENMKLSVEAKVAAAAAAGFIALTAGAIAQGQTGDANKDATSTMSQQREDRQDAREQKGDRQDAREQRGDRQEARGQREDRREAHRQRQQRFQNKSTKGKRG
jgi:hypothetical protein